MNSLGSSSKWPSYDSLSSNSSMLFSESEQTDDEADVFSEGEGDSRGNKSLSGDERITRCPEKTKHPVSSPADATLGSSPVTPGDLAFAQKVRTRQKILIFVISWFFINLISRANLSSYSSRLEICGGLSVLWLSFCTDWKLEDLTKVCVCAIFNFMTITSKVVLLLQCHTCFDIWIYFFFLLLQVYQVSSRVLQ